VRALALSCHPGPALAVTLFALALGLVAGAGGRTAPLVVSVFAGQLTIGWLNDLVDARRDARVGRRDKPAALGLVSARTLTVAITCAAAVLVLASAFLGGRAFGVNLFTVACGWAYDLGIKATVLSAVPYALAFGLLPGVATLSAGSWPAGWVVAAGALIGVAAHLTNALPDLDDDAATGVRGLPHRLGARPSLLLAVALLVAGTLCGVLGPPGPPRAVGWVGLGIVVAALLLTGPALWRHPQSRLAFGGVIALAGIDVVLVIVVGHLG
jgi:4-hydroxybenzoate polyprenyltransferase